MLNRKKLSKTSGLLHYRRLMQLVFCLIFFIIGSKTGIARGIDPYSISLDISIAKAYQLNNKCKDTLILPFNTGFSSTQESSSSPLLQSATFLKILAAFKALGIQQIPLQDSMVFRYSALDANGLPRYRVKGTLFSKPNEIYFRLGDSLLLDYQPWSVDSLNSIRITPGGILVSSFTLTGDSAIVSVASEQNVPNSRINIQVQNFDIRSLLELLKRDTLTATGTVDANFAISDFYKCIPALTGDLNFKDLNVMQSPVGDLRLTTQKTVEDQVSVRIELTGNENSFFATGNYLLNNEQQELDMLLDVQKLKLITLRGILKKYLETATGFLTGKLAVKGKFKQPEWSGDLELDTASVMLPQLKTAYFINKQNISFDYPTIRFKDFTFSDSLKNTLVLNGDVRSLSLTEYDLGLKLSSTGFGLFNVQQAINNQLTGLATVDADLAISGTIQQPKIEGDIYLDKKTALTLLLPERSVNRDAARAVVRFVDRDKATLTESIGIMPRNEPIANYDSFLNKQLRIHVGKDASLSFVVDPSSGDELIVMGLAKLNPGMDSMNNFVLKGAYTIDSGYYILNSQFLKKRFRLLKGCTIFFDGPPLNARINIRAEYIANTSPQELLGNEVGLIDKQLAYSFKQPIPFRVMLFMKGSVNKPAISFDILLPEVALADNQLSRTIDHKLIQLRSDVAATNKQVFALLALDRFVGEQSTDFFKGSGDGFNDLARESVSNFLSSALDEIASDLFKGINVDLNLNSYKDFILNSGGQNKDLSVEVSKNFLNDRLNVVVGKNFGIEGQDGSAKAAQQKGSRFLPDVTVNYKLSKDGKYMLRAFNKNQFEVILDGYIVETGLAFIVTIDYDLFNELFTSIKTRNTR